MAISEMERNGQSATEEAQVAHWIHEIHKSTKRIVDFFNGAEKDLQFIHVWDLKENIIQLFKCFDEFKHDETWPDTEDWPASFLTWRLKELELEHAKEISGGLVDFAGKFQRFIEDKYIRQDTDLRFSPSDINYSMEECLIYLLNITGNLNIQLGPIGKKRLGTVKTITRSVFKVFDRFRFAQHLKDLTDGFASISKVAEVWAK